MQSLLDLILALAKLANTSEGHTVVTILGATVYDLVRRYSKTRLPAGFFWSVYHGLRWLSEVSANLASVMDSSMGQNIKGEHLK